MFIFKTTNLPEKHSVGCIFLRLVGSETLDPKEGYFCVLKEISPLLKKRRFLKHTPGFYFNYIKNEDVPGGGFRITLYTINYLKTKETINDFLIKNGKVEIFENKQSYWPKNQNLEKINSVELSFRNTLNISSKTIIDLLEKYKIDELINIIESVFLAFNLGIKPKLILECIFNKYSKNFKRLSTEEYWENLILQFPNGWPLHILANMTRAREMRIESHS